MKDYGGVNWKSSLMLKILMEIVNVKYMLYIVMNMNINSFIYLLIIYMFFSWWMDVMEEKSLLVKKRERIKEEDVE